MSTRKYNQAYRKKNKKQITAQRAEYRRKNKKKLAKSDARYYQKHKKKYAKNNAEYRRTNKKRLALLRAEYWRKNKKKLMKLQAEKRSCPKVKAEIADHRSEYYLKNKKGEKANAIKWMKTVEGRHYSVLSRHKRALATRDRKSHPMSLQAHRKKLYFANGHERPCWYCSGANNKTGSGLDRLDNDKTYTAANTVPACRGCNVWRGSTHTVQETRDHFKPMRDAARLKKKENQCQKENL
jgi:hypothetical protein